jgi:hypothetical protein
MRYLLIFLSYSISGTSGLCQSETHHLNIGTQWTFEKSEYFGGGHGKIAYGTATITDTSITNGKKIYSFSGFDSFYVENDKMYFWDAMLKSYEMHYDFNSTSGYEIKYWDWSRQSIQIAQVNVDSVYNTIINSDTIPTQLLRISNSGSFDPFLIPVYKNIGASEYTIKLYLGFGLFDPNPIVTKLRCFKSDSIEYNFQNYSCDSTWLITKTGNLESIELDIRPNPTNGKIKIYGIKSDVSFTLFNMQGQSILTGNSIDGEIEVPLHGTFILKIHDNEGYYLKKIIRL